MKLILLVFTLVILISCKKNNDGAVVVPVPVDTLATGWKKITLPGLASGSDIFFINNTTGFSVGGNDISRSTDGGNTWQKVYQSNNAFVNIAMGSASNAVFVTAATGGTGTSKLFITVNGGNTFDSIVLADNINDVFFVSSSVAYAIGKKCWKTTSGGINWYPVYDFGTSVPEYYKSFHFLTEQTGWWAGAGGVFKTMNGGLNWTQQPTTGFNFTGLGNVFFTDASKGFVSDGYNIGKSTDGGASWNKIYTLNPGYHDLHFITNNIGYVTDNNIIYKTTDGGNTWTKDVIMVNAGIIEIHFTDANHGWATLGSGSILKYER